MQVSSVNIYLSEIEIIEYSHHGFDNFNSKLCILTSDFLADRKIVWATQRKDEFLLRSLSLFCLSAETFLARNFYRLLPYSNPYILSNYLFLIKPKVIGVSGGVFRKNTEFETEDYLWIAANFQIQAI